jgi:hypothetical protein
MQLFPTPNPFYAARRQTTQRPERVVYAKLPLAPRNASPVPHLTSLYHNAEPGNYGNRGYPGNCSGNLIKDLLLYFQPKIVCDPMTGSGTCRDVCLELGLPCTSWDIHQGIDACDPQGFPTADKFDFIWAHPPYWRMKRYALDERDLSRAPTLDAFLKPYGQFLRNCAAALKPSGKLAVLVGDYTDREAGFVPLVYWTKRCAFDAGLRQHCTDVVRFGHGASSSTKVYRSSFIPGLHDICCLFERGA